ncbi:MAG: hypothetical protein IPH43_11290 [Xanthomonadales bacterium]|nr:hypothetical protein [Xanthomonadales bacterium]
MSASLGRRSIQIFKSIFPCQSGTVDPRDPEERRGRRNNFYSWIYNYGQYGRYRTNRRRLIAVESSSAFRSPQTT